MPNPCQQNLIQIAFIILSGTKIMNSTYTTHQTEMVNIEQIIHPRTGLHTYSPNSKKRGNAIDLYLPKKNSKTHLVYIFTNHTWINNTRNSKVYSSFEGVSSDHRIVSTKIRLSLRRNYKQLKLRYMTCPRLPPVIYANCKRQVWYFSQDILQMTYIKILLPPM